METFAKILLFLGLLVWILVDMRATRKRPAGDFDKQAGWPNASMEKLRARYFLLGLAAAMYLFAFNEWVDPSVPPFTGKLSAIEAVLYSSFGPGASAFFWAAIASLFAFLGIRANGR